MSVATKLQDKLPFEINWGPKKTRTISQDDTINHVVEAYRNGKKDGHNEALNSEKKMVALAFRKNLEMAMHKSHAFFQQLAQDGLKPSSMHLKVIGLDEFKVALVLPTDLFYSDNRRTVTERTMDFEDDCCDTEFSLTFLTLPNKKELDTNSLILDGFIFQYDTKQKRTRAKA